ncbi:hypothetical protein ElyMa_002367200 [Elysia marginata]|uniref:MAM domain-containing protein n=1 Tax=Elysia marginata TaxID=1093978 RepID=A0AAV4GC49_9GAST|nr:hypothetical protein ElyMa_002367200 [Elysia marginata]
MKGPFKDDYQPKARKSSKGGYIYLPRHVTRPASIATQISTRINAMCIQFKYATQSETSLDVEIFDGGNSTVLHTFRASNTFGLWKTAGPVSCCLPYKKHRWMAFTSNSPNETIAIDYIEMTHSPRSCDDGPSCFAFPVSGFTKTDRSSSYPPASKGTITTEQPNSLPPAMSVEPQAPKNTQRMLLNELKKRQARMLKQLQDLQYLHNSQTLRNLQQIQNLISMQQQLQQESDQK